MKGRRGSRKGARALRKECSGLPGVPEAASSEVVAECLKGIQLASGASRGPTCTLVCTPGTPRDMTGSCAECPAGVTACTVRGACHGKSTWHGKRATRRSQHSTNTELGALLGGLTSNNAMLEQHIKPNTITPLLSPLCHALTPISTEVPCEQPGVNLGAVSPQRAEELTSF